jgi:hypothetical protein
MDRWARDGCELRDDAAELFSRPMITSQVLGEVTLAR